MIQPYPYTRQNPFHYQFTSVGKETIEKVAIFDPDPLPDYVAFLFGDLNPDGELDVYKISNNGDRLNVQATLICIIAAFLNEHPDQTVFFTGSTPIRTQLCARILAENYSEFTKQFKITALAKSRNGFHKILFTPASNINYHGFYIQKIN